MSWYYTREVGNEGQVLTDDGTPDGRPVTAMLQKARIPMAVCLEIVAFLADILTIAEEDRALHGDINPGDVFIDQRGNVSLAGFGLARRAGRAPDSPPQLPASDVYGLGVVMHALLSTEPMGPVPRERDAHDDAIVDRLLSIDWSEMEGVPGRDPVIHFLCSMLAHSPAERPAPLDVANIVSGAAAKIGGQSLAAWARRTDPEPLRLGAADAPTDEEVLEAPQRAETMFGQSRRRQTASSKGECTAFWSRDKIAAMLDEGEDQVSASAMFDRRDLAARLHRAEPSTPTKEAYPDEQPWSPDATLTGNNAPPKLREAMSELKRSASREPVELPSQGPRVASPAPPAAVAPPPPVAVPGAAPLAEAGPPRASPAPPRTPAPKPFPWVPVLLGLVGMGMVLALFAVAGVAYLYLQAQDESPAPSPRQSSSATESPARPEPPPEEPETTAPPPARARSTGTTKRTPRRTPPARRAPSPSSAPTAVSDEFEIAFRALDAKAVLQCGDGQTGTFVGMTRRTFSGVTTCRIDIGDAKGAVQVSRSGTVTCAAVGATVNCSGP